MNEQMQSDPKHERVLHHMVKRGTVVSTDYLWDQGLVTVRIGTEKDFIDLSLPWLRLRGGHDWEWWAPEIDESVVILSPEGDLRDAMIIGSLPYAAKEPFVTSEKSDKNHGEVALRAVQSEGDKETRKQKTAHMVQYQDGSSFYYNKEAHFYKMRLCTREDDKAPESKINFAFSANEKEPLIDLEKQIAANQLAFIIDAVKDKEKLQLAAGDKSLLTLDGTKDKNMLKLAATPQAALTLNGTKDQVVSRLMATDKASLTLTGKEDKQKATLVATNKVTLTLDGKEGSQKAAMKATNKVTLTLDGKEGSQQAAMRATDDVILTLSAEKGLTVEWFGNHFKLEKNGDVDIKCAKFTLNASGEVNLKGSKVNVTGSAVNLAKG
jgi:phage baseplate assembly protein gpV